MDSNGENARPINNESVYNHFDFTWSPDERLLVYVRFHQTELTQAPEIWIYDMSIQNAWRLLRGGYAPRWIP
jgi:Tol biopolymer transport system component